MAACAALCIILDAGVRFRQPGSTPVPRPPCPQKTGRWHYRLNRLSCGKAHLRRGSRQRPTAACLLRCMRPVIGRSGSPLIKSTTTSSPTRGICTHGVQPAQALDTHPAGAGVIAFARHSSGTSPSRGHIGLSVQILSPCGPTTFARSAGRRCARCSAPDGRTPTPG